MQDSSSFLTSRVFFFPSSISGLSRSEYPSPGHVRQAEHQRGAEEEDLDLSGALSGQPHQHDEGPKHRSVTPLFHLHHLQSKSCQKTKGNHALICPPKNPISLILSSSLHNLQDIVDKIFVLI